ncbi:MAG: UPF0179 family protein [Thermoplasmatales archaeon]|nr:UPF0179 family protein [Thermoplasmatales archaeon]
MMVVTLVGVKIAKEGNEFIYYGVANTCKNCKLKTVCSNLEEGRAYKILKIREKKHECPLHEGGVIAVEVEKIPYEINVKSQEAEATSISFKPMRCNEFSCNEYKACNPKIKEKEYRILRVLDDVECPKGYNIKKIVVD